MRVSHTVHTHRAHRPIVIKKIVDTREHASEIIPTHSFTFLFTISCQSVIGDFRVFYSLIYRQKSFCINCDRINNFNHDFCLSTQIN